LAIISTANLKRWPEQVGYSACREAKLRALAAYERVHRGRARVEAISRLELLPASTIGAIRQVEIATAGYDALTLTIAVGYGGREEICDAVRACSHRWTSRALASPKLDSM
jgi:short-chain Z-isoprenyl diphosphate synthase